MDKVYFGGTLPLANQFLVHILHNFQPIRIVVLNESICPVQYLLIRTVIFIQGDSFGPGKMLAKLNDVTDRGSPETINGLVIVPRHRYILGVSRE